MEVEVVEEEVELEVMEVEVEVEVVEVLTVCWCRQREVKSVQQSPRMEHLRSQ